MLSFAVIFEYLAVSPDWDDGQITHFVGKKSPQSAKQNITSVLFCFVSEGRQKAHSKAVTGRF